MKNLQAGESVPIIDAESTEGVEYAPVKWLTDQRRAISNHHKANLPDRTDYRQIRTDLARVYLALYEIERSIRAMRDLPPIGDIPTWVTRTLFM